MSSHFKRNPSKDGFPRGKMTSDMQKTYLNDAISRTSSKPLVAWLNSNTPYPTQVPRNDAHEFPRRVICRFDGARLFVERKRLSEICGARQ